MTGYPFKRGVLGPFHVHVSHVEPGMLHKKRFAAPSSAAEQRTLNLYVRGQFRVSCAGVSMTYGPGSSSLDWPWIYPAGELVVEEPLEQGVRVCVQPVSDTPWTRTRLTPQPGQELAGNLLVVVDDKLVLTHKYTTTGAEADMWSFSIATP